MNRPVIDPGIPSEDGGRRRRLNSWKEIAVHLGRDVRTVQRWHLRAGMPVHRHADPQQRGVFAFEDEVDTWANRTREGTGAESVETAEAAGGDPCPPFVRPSRRLAAWMAGSLLIVTALLATWAFRAGSERGVPFDERDWLLVAAIDNRTGDDAMEETIQYALEHELGASSFVNVVSRERVGDVLRLMRRPQDSVLAPEIAREVALRDGDIQAIITGRVDRVDTTYMLRLELVDPVTSVAVQSRTQEAQSKREVLGGIRRLAVWVRTALGERSMAASAADVRLPRVTTSSLTALRLYGKAQQALAENHSRAAREFLETALREDPEFASGHLSLAEALARDPAYRQEDSLMRQHLDRAFALSHGLADEERLWIAGQYYASRGDLDDALAANEALVRLRPDNWRAHNELGALYLGRRRIREGTTAIEQAVALRPNDFRLAVRAAQVWANSAIEPDKARPHVERAKALWPAQAAEYSSQRLGHLPPPYARDVAWILLFPAYERWRAGDLENMVAEVRRVFASEPLAQETERDAFIPIGVSMMMTAGRLREATALAERMVDDAARDAQLSVIPDSVDDLASVRRYLSRPAWQGDGRPLRYVRAGLFDVAKEILAFPGNRPGLNGNADAARGVLALRAGRSEEGIDLLRRSIERSRSQRLSERYLAAESLATELQRLGQHEEALAVLEAAAADEPTFTRTGVSGAFWLRVLARLAREYQARGRAADAETVKQRLGQLLAVGDDTHPLKVELSRSHLPQGYR